VPADVRVAPLAEQTGSEKETWHIDFDLSGCGLDYVVGDSFGSSPATIWAMSIKSLPCLGASHTTESEARPFASCCATMCRWRPRRIRCSTDFVHHRWRAAREARALAQGEDPDGDAATLDVMAGAAEVLRRGVRIPKRLSSGWSHWQPRLYSSRRRTTPRPQAVADGGLRSLRGRQRKRLGLASTFLAERIKPGDEIEGLCQKAHGFALRRIRKRRSS